MLFNNKNKKEGCFNHEVDDNNYKYNLNIEELINEFLSYAKYSVCMVDDNLNPLSFLRLDDNKNMIFSVCTNFKYRGNGHMTLLLNHIFNLIKYNKLIINMGLQNFKLTVYKKNPIKDKLIKYYEKFGFKIIDEDNLYYTMEYQI